MSNDFDIEYDQAVSRLPMFSQALEQLLHRLLEASSIQTHSVTSRVKSKESTLRKLQKADEERAISSLTDLAGIRVITYFPDEVDEVAKLIEQEFIVDRDSSIDKRAILEPDRFGYLSLHYILQLSTSRSGLVEYQVYKDLKFELQVRSILQHSWAEIEHDLGYKSKAAIPKAVRRRFSRLAGLLELADDEFLGIRKELAAHRATSESAISKGDLDAEIDQISLVSFLGSDVMVKNMERYLADLAGRPYTGKVISGYLDRVINGLVKSEFKTIADISRFLHEKETLIQAFAKYWVAETQQAWKGAPKPIPAGISIFYISLVRAAEMLANGDITEDSLEFKRDPERYRRAIQLAREELKNTES
jgi:putative GTP pyrophosphokinase